MKSFILFFIFLSISHTCCFGQAMKWVEIPEGNSPHMEGIATVTDGEGNVYTGGIFNEDIDFDPGPGEFILSGDESSLYVQKLDSSGNFIWAASAVGDGADWLTDVTLDSLGNIYATGWVEDSTDFDSAEGAEIVIPENALGGFIWKLDTDGNTLWAHGFTGIESESDPGITEVFSYGIDVDPAGSVYVTGVFSGTIDFDAGEDVFMLTSFTPDNFDCFIMKLTSDGDFLWAANFGGDYGDLSYAIGVSAESFIYIAGSYSASADMDPGPGEQLLSAAGVEDIYVLKLTGDGEFVWARSIGAAGQDIAKSLEVRNDESVVISGIFHQLVDFDPGLNEYNLQAVGNADIFVVTLSPAGELLWADAFGSIIYDEMADLAIDDAGSVYLIGNVTFAPIDFDPGEGIHQLVATGGFDSDPFVLSLSNSGDFNWVINFGGESIDYGQSVAVCPNGELVVSGCWQSTVDLDPGPAVFEDYNFGLALFVMKLGPCDTPLLSGEIMGSSTVCYGEAETYSIESLGDINDYYWSYSGFPDIVSGQHSTAIEAIFYEPTVLSLTPIFGCEAGSPVTLTITGQAIPEVSASYSPMIVCPQDEVVLTGIGASTYDWTNGVIDGIPFTIGETAIFTVTGNTEFGCEGHYDITIFVNEAPVVISGPTDQSVAEGTTIEFHTTAEGAETYNWEENSGSGFVGLVDAGNYSGSGSPDLTITGLPLSSNGNLYRCVVSNWSCYDTTSNAVIQVFLGIENILNSSFCAYPNPLKDIMVIKSASDKVSGYIIYDQAGRVVVTGRTTGAISEVDVANLTPGVYTLNLADENLRLLKFE